MQGRTMYVGRCLTLSPSEIYTKSPTTRSRAGKVICRPSRKTCTSEGSMPAMEAMTRPVEKSCHAFCPVSGHPLLAFRSRTKTVCMTMTTRITMARARFETCGAGSPRGFLIKNQ